jgi:hypothetical protein
MKNVHETISQPVTGHVVVCLYSQAAQESGIRKIKFLHQSGEKLCGTPSNGKIWVWWCAPVIQAMVRSVKYEDHSPLTWAKKKSSISKITRATALEAWLLHSNKNTTIQNK